MSQPESAREAYDRYAPVYDESNAQNDYEMWLGEGLLPELERRGLGEGWALDVGCGTGRAFDPLLGRGWQVVGCDVSTGMLGEARRKFGARVRLLEADARNLPPISPSPELPAGESFDLVLLLNDVVNYMVDDGDLGLVFAGVRRNLGREGLVVFDANTVSLLSEDFASDVAEQTGPARGEWRGLTDEVGPGRVYEAELRSDGVEAHVHRQRHWTIEEVKEALGASDLRCLAALGQREEANRVHLSASPDEERDAKIIYIASRAA
jgi:SAM-dependent methyltransferase